MTEQLTLAPSHRNDPEESRQAAAKVNAARQRDLVLLALSGVPDGLTDDELGEACGLLRHAAGTRRGVAVREGLVERCGTGETPRGNACGVWRLSPAGWRYVEEMKRRRG
jgi:hypothetical protein